MASRVSLDESVHGKATGLVMGDGSAGVILSNYRDLCDVDPPVDDYISPAKWNGVENFLADSGLGLRATVTDHGAR